MENQDKIFEQFKSAAQKAETKDFDALEKVWSRVDAKLDTKVLKKQNNNWKKLVVAASVVVLITILFQLVKPNNNIALPKPLLQNKEVIQEKEVLQEKKLETVTEESSKIVKENKDAILEKQISPNVETVATITEAEKIEDKISIIPSGQNIVNSVSTNHSNSTLKGNVYEARGVRQEPKAHETTEDKTPEKQVTKKSPPLLVVDGETMTKNKKSTKKALADEDIESVIELKEPLYIINGVHYSEESLFGKNPTSPYAPLDQQEITKTEVLLGQEAIDKYGKKGVLIITTKNRKPAVRK